MICKQCNGTGRVVPKTTTYLWRYMEGGEEQHFYLTMPTLPNSNNNTNTHTNKTNNERYMPTASI